MILDIKEKIAKLMEVRCDCVRSIRASTECWRCKWIRLLHEQSKENK